MTLRAMVCATAACVLAAAAGAGAQTAPVNNFPLAWCVHGPEEPGINFAGLPIQRGRAEIFYEQHIGKFPRVYIDPRTGQGHPENGGIPQRTDWSAHLTKVNRDVTNRIPDPNWDGYAILDFETWHPNWDMFSNEFMKTMSRDWVRARFPGLSEAQVEARAHEEFEAAGMDFMLRTLQACKDLRPRAKWGFYGYPYYYPPHLQEEFRPLFSAIDAFFPDVYACHYSVPDTQTPQPGQKRLARYIDDMEGKMRIAQEYGPGKPIYTIVWMRYHEMNSRYGGQFINDLDLSAMFRTPWRSGVKGAIFWDVIRTAEERDGYNEFFAGRGGAGLRAFLNEVSPPPPPTSPVSPLVRNTGGTATGAAPTAKTSSKVRTIMPVAPPQQQTAQNAPAGAPSNHGATRTTRTASAPTD